MGGHLQVRRFGGEPPPLLALHGFTQTGAMFAELAGLLGREVAAPDLPGHGGSAHLEATFQAAVLSTTRVLKAMGPIPVLGYSLGGRVALAMSLARPDLVSHLMLVSASTGIEDPVRRAQRLADDFALAARLESMGVPAFLDEWLDRPMFAGLRRRGAAWQAQDRARRLENGTAGLAAALRGSGQGAQPFLGGRLDELTMPVLLLVGEEDERYVAAAETIAGRVETAALAVVPGAGHALIGEDPRFCADLISQFLSDSTGRRTEGQQQPDQEVEAGHTPQGPDQRRTLGLPMDRSDDGVGGR